MTIKVNPPQQLNIPAKILEDDDLSNYFSYQHEILYKMWLRSGGGTDFLAGLQNQIDAIIIRLDLIEARLDAAEARLTYLEGTTVVTAIDYTVINTVTGHTTVICTANVTIKLTSTPNDRDTVIVKQVSTALNINGNGRTIDGSPTLSVRNLRQSAKAGIKMEYSLDLDAWFIV